MLSGIGFTMALFITTLALDESLLATGKIGVLVGSTIGAGRNGHDPAVFTVAGWRGGIVSCLLFPLGQKDREAASFGRPAGHVDPAAMFLDDAVGDR